MNRDDFYKPVAIEIELTTRCSILCRHCGIYNEIKGKSIDLTVAEVLNVLQQAKELGVSAYTLTGGDPLTRLEDVCSIIKEAPIDLCKLALNGKFFGTKDQTQKILYKLKDAGIAKRNKQHTPLLNICIGIQTEAGVPLKNIAIFTRLCLGIFPDNVGIYLNIAEPPGVDVEPWLKELDNEYRTMTGFPYPFDLVRGSILDVFEIPGQDNSSAFPPERITVGEFAKKDLDRCSCKNFDPASSDNIFPRCLVRADGRVYPCCSYYHINCVGNIKTEPLKTLFARINNDPALKIIIEESHPAFYKKRLAENPSLADKLIPAASSLCAVCGVLREGLTNKNQK